MSCCYWLKSNQECNICFAIIKFALIKRYHLHMCNRVLLLFGKLPHWNVYVNCHVNGMTFQNGLRFQTALSSLRVSRKRALSKGMSSIYSKVIIEKNMTYSDLRFRSLKSSPPGKFLEISDSRRYYWTFKLLVAT